MNWRPLIIALSLMIFGSLILVFMLGAAFLGLGGDQEGENPNSSQVAGEAGPAVDSGPLSDTVPSILAALFKEAGGAVGVPAALLAAVSNQECGRVWRLPEEKLRPLITNNADFPIREQAKASDLGHMGCAFDNGSNVWGPMQFQYMTFFGFPVCTQRAKKRCVRWEVNGKSSNERFASDLIANNRELQPQNHPIPLTRTAGGQAGELTHKTPASIISLKDSVYAAAIKLRADAGRRGKPKSADWTDTEIQDAACAYYGKCKDAAADYKNDVFRKYEQFKGQLSG